MEFNLTINLFLLINALNKSRLNDSTKDLCKDGFKKCKILDTYGNIMCLENNLSCPINEIIIDNKKKKKNI